MPRHDIREGASAIDPELPLFHAQAPSSPSMITLPSP
jgi:hypothetical protein